MFLIKKAFTFTNLVSATRQHAASAELLQFHCNSHFIKFLFGVLVVFLDTLTFLWTEQFWKQCCDRRYLYLLGLIGTIHLFTVFITEFC
jgi:hypothetical protein